MINEDTFDLKFLKNNFLHYIFYEKVLIPLKLNVISLKLNLSLSTYKIYRIVFQEAEIYLKAI